MEKNGLFYSDEEEEKIEYNPDEQTEEVPQVHNSAQQIYDQPISDNGIDSFSPAARETEIVHNDTSPIGYGSGDEDLEETNGKEYKFDYDCPYPDITVDSSPFTVKDPIKIGHITYSITGQDKDGQFEGSRRFKDFHSLRAALVTRWPGVYVPPLPPKQSIGNKKDKFIASRMFFLDLFLKKLSNIPYLVNSEEFQKFSKPAGDITATLTVLGPITPVALTERFEKELGISTTIDEATFRKSREEVNDFQSFCKKILVTLKTIKDQSEKIVNSMDITNKRTGAIVDAMSFYESNGMTMFVDQDVSKFIVENPLDSELKSKAEGINRNLSNTFKDFYFWVISTLGDTEAILDAISGKDRIVQTRVKLDNKKKSYQSEMETLNSGKKTFKTLFKSVSTKQNRIVFLNSDLEKIEKEISEYDVIIKMVNYHISENIIPEFKKKQLSDYYEFVNYIAKREINNCAAVTNFWNDFGKNENIPAEG